MALIPCYLTTVDVKHSTTVPFWWTCLSGYDMFTKIRSRYRPSAFNDLAYHHSCKGPLFHEKLISVQKYLQTRFKFGDSIVYEKGPIKEHPINLSQKQRLSFIKIHPLIINLILLLCHFNFQCLFPWFLRIYLFCKWVGKHQNWIYWIETIN